MAKVRMPVFLMFLMVLSSSLALAQFPGVTAEQLKVWMAGKQKPAVIDVRLPEEYAEAHIPGAINIPAENIRMEKARLPKDKSVPIILYCRGVG